MKNLTHDEMQMLYNAIDLSLTMEHRHRLALNAEDDYYENDLGYSLHRSKQIEELLIKIENL